MQPKIIKKDKLYITGLTGDGTQTLKVWTDFDNQYNTTPFPKMDETGYEIRFCESRVSGKAPNPDKSVHVGFLSERVMDGEYSTVELPASEYAVFEVYVAKGYDSGNEDMEKWLADNKMIYGIREFDGYEYVIEYYGEKFKDGDKPDSIVECWIPLFRYCQSCYMPMTKPEHFGKEKGGVPSTDYCCYCYDNTNGDIDCGIYGWGNDFDEYVEANIQFWRDGCKNDDEARVRIMEVFPKLKRWTK